MRPSDEHQASLKQSGARPNLMSAARRGGNEDSILARLDSAPDGSGRGARLAWYGAAALVAVGLTATLAWLAASSGHPALEVAQAGELRMMTAHPVAEREREREREPAPPPAPALPVRAAVIVDAAPGAPDPGALAPAASAHLRLLEPAPLPAPPRMAPPPAKAAPAAAEASRPARTRAQPARAPLRQAARPARATPPRPGESADDSDVALISAVIYHANGHADGQDRAPAACADDACRPRP